MPEEQQKRLRMAPIVSPAWARVPVGPAEERELEERLTGIFARLAAAAGEQADPRVHVCLESARSHAAVARRLVRRDSRTARALTALAERFLALAAGERA